MFKLWRVGIKSKEQEKIDLSGDLTSGRIQEILGDSSDVIVKEIYTWNKNVKIKAFGIDGMVDSEVIDEHVLRPLTVGQPFKSVKSEKEAFEIVKNGFLYHLDQQEVDTLNDAISNILQGITVVVFDNIKKAVAFDAKSIPQRGIQPSDDESVLKGAKDAFNENIRTNTALVRKKIKSPELRIEKFVTGNETNTNIEVIYLKDVVDHDVLDRIREKIKKLNVYGLISTENFESNIIDNKYSIFPQVLYTERVDKFCSNIIDGKVGVIIDGLPTAYIVPGVFAMFLQTPEDYSNNYFSSSLIRILRYICFGISLILPAFYVAITTFHHEMIPTDLMISIVKSKSGVPFVSAAEVVVMLLAFEVLLEASLRLPKAIGSTISIIGALIVGEAAVNAKFISPAVVVVIALAGVAGFVIPNLTLSNAIRLCRLLMVFVASFSGLFGISFMILILLSYLCKLETFGVPYLVPYVSNKGKGVLKDTLIRLPSDVSEGE